MHFSSSLRMHIFVFESFTEPKLIYKTRDLSSSLTWTLHLKPHITPMSSFFYINLNVHFFLAPLVVDD
jgi:hypothetical protein